MGPCRCWPLQKHLQISAMQVFDVCWGTSVRTGAALRCFVNIDTKIESLTRKAGVGVSSANVNIKK